jgi:hypothetical protein
MMVIHLSFKLKDTKKKDNKKRKTTKEEEGEDDETNTVNYHPKLERCGEFLTSALTMIATSTNKVCNLELDLMPFL